MDTLNRIVQHEVGPKLYDRKTQTVVHERLPLKPWLEVEVMYSRPVDLLDNTGVVRDALVNESIHSGHEYNKESSVKYIPDFIKFYEIDMSQFQKENPSDYKTFNDFFIREVKPGKRPVSDPEDNTVIVSAADCRLVVFNSFEETKDLWIKGKRFSFEKLLNYDKALMEHFREGYVVNFRLAPQDYHRFHSPIAGRIKDIVTVGGTTYSVKTKALESEIDVLGENERDIIVIEGAEGIGKVAYVAIGAERVGRVTSIVKQGDLVKKGDELGFFSYGGSDIVVLFEKKVIWDEDLREYSLQGIETMVWANERIGKFQL